MRNLRIPFVLLLLLAVSGCTGIEKAPREHATKLIQPVSSEELVFEDDDIRVVFTVSRRRINFTLWNKTQEPIAIIWDEVLFRDPEGATHWVLNREQDPKKVPAKTAQAASSHAYMESTAVPAESSYSDYVRPFPSGFQDVFVYPSKYAAGSRFKLTVPLEITGQIKIYTFGFEVMD